MNQSLQILIISILIVGCTNNNSTTKDNSTKSTAKETNVSYEGLMALLVSDEPIGVNYLVASLDPLPQKALYENSILQKSDEYILIKSRDNGTDAKNYYLLTFSKKTGRLISFIGLGQEAEGVDPSKVIWQTNDEFSTIDYKYELIEDEESGAYIKGVIQDSTIQNFVIDNKGLIKETSN